MCVLKSHFLCILYTHIHIAHGNPLSGSHWISDTSHIQYVCIYVMSAQAFAGEGERRGEGQRVHRSAAAWAQGLLGCACARMWSS